MKKIFKTTKPLIQYYKNKKLCKNHCKTLRCVETVSLDSGRCHEDGGSVVMEIASNDVKIRHVFCFTRFSSLPAE